MKRLTLSFLVAFFPACVAVDSPEAENNQPSAETSLENDFSAWCDSTCTRLEACPEAGVGSDCADECRETLEAYLGYGDDCAEIGRGLMDCVNEIRTCQDLHADYDCEEPRNTAAVCGFRNDYDDGDYDDDGDDVDVDVAPPTAAYGVSCQSGSGGGTAGAAGGDVTAFSCETLYEDCSDGARYQLVCDGTSEQATCNCFRSGVFTGSFETAPARCPSDLEMNAGCGWTLHNGY